MEPQLGGTPMIFEFTRKAMIVVSKLLVSLGYLSGSDESQSPKGAVTCHRCRMTSTCRG